MYPDTHFRTLIYDNFEYALDTDYIQILIGIWSELTCPFFMKIPGEYREIWYAFTNDIHGLQKYYSQSNKW